MSVLAELRSRYHYSDDAERYEIIDGLKVQLPPMSVDASCIASDLTTALNIFAGQKLGKAYTEMLIRLPLAVDRNRRPDVSFIPFSRWPNAKPRPSTNAWDVLPDLAAEVISPFDNLEDARAKMHEYFEAGVRLVWHILPTLRMVDVYESPTRVTILTRDDELDGGVVVPGFRLPLKELFIGD